MIATQAGQLYWPNVLALVYAVPDPRGLSMLVLHVPLGWVAQLTSLVASFGLAHELKRKLSIILIRGQHINDSTPIPPWLAPVVCQLYHVETTNY